MAHPSLTFPIACDHILQRPQDRMERVLNEHEKKTRVSGQFVAAKQEEEEEEEGEIERKLKNAE